MKTKVWLPAALAVTFLVGYSSIRVQHWEAQIERLHQKQLAQSTQSDIAIFGDGFSIFPSGKSGAELEREIFRITADDDFLRYFGTDGVAAVKEALHVMRNSAMVEEVDSDPLMQWRIEDRL